MAEAQDPRLLFLRSLDIEHVRVSYSAPIIVICGGRVDIAQPNSCSLRDAIYDNVNRYNGLLDMLCMPEEFPDWLNFGTYSDLIAFEKHLAAISYKTLVILESPGSIAELAAFSQSPFIMDKLMVVVQDNHYRNDSFIKLGVVQLIRSRVSGSVYVYDWDERDPDTITPEIVDFVYDDIREVVEKSSEPKVFKRDDVAHQMILIVSLLELFQALALREVQDFLRVFDIDVGEDDLKQMLFALEKVSVVLKDDKGNKSFYLKGERDFHSIDYRYIKGAKAYSDKDDAMLSVHNFYKSNARTERHRLNAIRRRYAESGDS